MEPGAVGAAGITQAGRRVDDVAAISSLVLLLALAAAAFGQGAFFSAVRLFIIALLAVAVLLGIVARSVQVEDLRNGFALSGVLLAGWALVRAFAAGTPASGLSWALFGAGTVAIVVVSRRLSDASHAMLFER